jgi:hypothetical protein
MAARLPALKVKEAQMQTEEARFLQMEASFSRRQQALRELREAVCAASVRLTPRAMARARSGDGEAELGSLRVAIECAEDTGALKADEVLAVRARALVVELEAEHERVAAAAAHAAAKAHRAAAASRLSAALDAADGSIGLRLRTLREAIHEARAAGFDDNELLVAEVTREALEATLQQQIAEAEANLVHTLRSTWGPRVSAEDARQRLLQLARTGKFGFDTAIRTLSGGVEGRNDWEHSEWEHVKWEHTERLESFVHNLRRILDLGCDCGRPWKHLSRLSTPNARIRDECASSKRKGYFTCPECRGSWSSMHAFKGSGQACKRCDHDGRGRVKVAPVKLVQCDFDFSEPGMNQGAHDEVRCQRCQERRLNCVTGRALVGR